MKRLISAQTAGKILMAAMVLLTALHVLILMGVVPYEMVWGGMIKDERSLVAYELFAVATSLLFLAVTYMKIHYTTPGTVKKVSYAAAWVMVAYFLLNTAGNAASAVTLEKIIFTPVTVVLSLLALRVALEK